MGRVLTSCAIVALFLLTFVPIVSSDESSSETVRICCGAGEYDLLFIGSDGAASLTPFDNELGTEERILLQNAITQVEEIQSWEYTPGWGGVYPDSTWHFTLPYEVNNAAGIEINATVTVEIGSRTYQGYSGPGNTYLPAGDSNLLEVSINIDEANMGGTDSVKISLSVQTLVFSLPGTDANVEFIWGTEDNRGHIGVELPLVDMNMGKPIVDGRSVFLQVKFSSGFGTKIIGSSDSIDVSIGGNTINDMPVLEIQGQDIMATWTWNADSSIPNGEYSVNISLSVQSGAAPLQGEITWDITFGAGGGSSGGIYYPSEEPPLTDGSGSNLKVQITGELSTDNDQLVISRTTELTFSDSSSLWMRWGLTNIGNSSLDSDSTWNMFVGGSVTDEMRSNQLLDEVELREVGQQLQSGRLMTFLDNGLYLESDELLGGRFSDFQTIEVVIENNGENRIMYADITMTISSTQIVTDSERYNLVRSFIKPQPEIYWKNVDMNIEMTSSAGTSFAHIFKDNNGVDVNLDHKRLGSSEHLKATIDGIEPEDTISIGIQPTSNVLYSPSLLLIVVCTGLLVPLIISLKISKNKSRLALFIEIPFAVLSALGYILAYPMETLVVVTGGTGALWILTAFVSPRKINRTDSGSNNDDLPDIPTIDCPKCTTTNPIVTSQRPTRLPCGGCGVILKIVE